MLWAVGMTCDSKSTWSLSRKATGVSDPLLVVSLWGAPPSRGMIHTSRLPSRVDTKAMFLLSGLHTG